MRRTVVDGEHFHVTERADEPGVYDMVWTSGPNEGYGFATSSYGRQPQGEEELKGAIRTFLAQVDPRSGYIE